MAKTVLITGASRGIGAATARLFAEKGFNTAICYNRGEEKALALVRELTQKGFNAIAIKLDVCNPENCNEAIEKCVKAFGGINVLVNNAGIAQQKLVTDITDSDWNTMLNTNLSGVFYCCRAAAPYFISQKMGNIVNVSSMWGVTGASMEVHYSAAKAGVIGLTKALAKELGPSNIRVNCIAPGVIQTEMNKALSGETISALCDDTPLCRTGKPEEIARAIYFLAEEADFITGQVLTADGGMTV